MGGSIVVALVAVQQKRHDAEMVALRQQLHSVEARFGDGERQPIVRDALPLSGGASGYAPPAPPAPSPASTSSGKAAPDVVKSRAIEPPELRDYYEEVFVQDHSDTEWTVTERRIVSDKIGAVLPKGSVLRSVECRTSMCRIETSHADLERYKQFYRSAFMERPAQIWNAGMFSTPLNDNIPTEGPIVMVSFLAREGKQLPPFME